MLEVEGLQHSYAGVRALKGIDLTVEAGEVVALIGANGAGKTTTLRSVSRLLPPSGGSVSFEGRDITRWPPHAVARLGIGHVLEGRHLFPHMSVRENLQMGAYLRRDKEGIRKTEEEAFELFPRLRERLAQEAGTLSGGEQQMLAIARALMARPRLLLLDEPSVGLAPIVVRHIFLAIQEIAKRGCTILLVEQNARMALRVADRAYVLELGEIVLADAATRLLNSDELKKSYLGPEHG